MRKNRPEEIGFKRTYIFYETFCVFHTEATSFSESCDRQMSRYTSFVLYSSLCVPVATSSPSSRTSILSAFFTVLTRCDTKNTVVSFKFSFKAFLRAASVAKSSALDESSKSISEGAPLLPLLCKVAAFDLPTDFCYFPQLRCLCRPLALIQIPRFAKP